jgi:hypothetical protein
MQNLEHGQQYKNIKIKIMGSLSNLYISQSYQSLIHLGTNNTASANLIELQDGLGNSIGVAVNTNGDLFLSGSLTASLQQGYLYVGGANGKTTAFATSSLVTNINTGSLVTTSSFNSYTQSTNIRLDNLETTSASVNVSISNLNSTTASQGVSITNLNSATQSLFTSTSLSLTTASFSGNTLTFTKGDASTFGVVIPDVSGSTINTGSFATTGSNAFIGNQIITGSVTISGSSTSDLTVVGQIFVSSSATGGTTAPKITVSGSQGQSTITRNEISSRNLTYTAALNPYAIFASNITTSDEIGFTVDAAGFGFTGWQTGSAIYINDPTDTYPAIFGFQNKATYTDGRVAVLTPLSASAGFTASLQNGYAWVGNSLGQNTQVATSSFGTAIDTGSYATTGSNTFTGDQTLIDNAGNFYTISDASGSMMLVAKGFTSASAHISASSAGIGNFIFKTNSNTADTIISGSNNIFTNAATPTAGFKRYIGGVNNIINTQGLPQISGSMQFSPGMNQNYIIGGVTMRGPISASAYGINNNVIQGNISIGSSATLNAEKLTSGLTLNGNTIGGTLTIVANQSALTGSTTSFTNNTIAGAATLNLSSSAASMTFNIINDNAFIFTNQFYSSSVGLGSVAMNRNNIAGQGNSVIVVGAQPAGTTTATSFSDNFIGGGGNIVYGDIANARVSGTTAYHNVIRNIIFGQSLIITGSSVLSDTTSFGSAFFGRYNAADTNRNKTAETIFAVGTGTTTSLRKTGFLIDSGSNSYFEGTVNVSGSLLLNGNIVSAVNTGSFATTGSNSFIGNQTITGSLTVSGSGAQVRLPQFDATQGRIKETLSFTGSRFATGIISTSIEMENLSSYQFGFNQLATGDSLTGTQFILETNKDSGFTELKLNARYTGSNNADIAIRNAAGVRTFTVNADSTTINGSLVVNGTTLNPAAYATTGSNSFNGNQTITGSLTISGSIITVDRSGNTGNVYLGENALGMGSGGSQPLAFGNSVSIAIGQGAMRYASGSQQNVAIGVDALKITSGSNNFALGSYSLESNTTGGENVALGTGALNKNISGQRNVGLGGGALFGSTTGDFNIGVGYNTGAALSGSTNVFIGYRSGETFSGSKNVLIGGYRGVGETLNNNIILSDGDGDIKAQYSGSNWNFTNTTISGSLIIQSGSSFFANGNRQFNVGAFSSNITQSGSANVSQSMNFEVTDISEGVTIASNSRITLANSGTYNIQFSVQIDRVSGFGTDTVHIWLKKNGTNVSASAGAVTISGGAAAAKTIAAWNYVVDAAASDYYELVWEATDSNIQLINQAAGGNIPSTPSIILTVTQVR